MSARSRPAVRLRGLLAATLYVALYVAPYVALLSLPVARADNCGQYLRDVRRLVDVPQAALEDCMRTGWAQALATGVVAATAGAAIAAGVAQALRMRGGEDAEEDEEAEWLELEEATSNQFRLRLRSSMALSLGLTFSYVGFDIEQWDGVQWTGRRALSMFLPLTLSPSVKVEWLGASSDWASFVTPEALVIDDFDGLRGAVIMGPSATLFSRRASVRTGSQVVFRFPTGEPPRDVATVRVPLEIDSKGVSLVAGSHVSGRWQVDGS